MISKILSWILLGLLLTPPGAFSQDVHKTFIFPDIPGYETLICDLHMHTVFSDGLVWPTVRVKEAVNEGLDAISITEHLEYYSHSKYISGDHNSSYEIAKPLADKKGLILIRGAEITKGMPPGHFNFLFIQDANIIDSVDWKKAIIQANEQGAFVFWNHPGWRQENEIPIWYEEHSWLLERNMFQGIEIVNENSYYSLAHQWCIDSNLTMLGNSDIHDPLYYFFDRSKGEHRPITLVFAKERSEEGIREALDNRRTAIYYKNLLIGDEQYLGPLFRESVEIIDAISQGSDKDPITYLMNSASITYKLVYFDSNGMEHDPIYLEGGKRAQMTKPADEDNGIWVVQNLIISPGKYLEVKL